MLITQMWHLTSLSLAVENSWTADFIDQSLLEGLRAHIVEQLTLGMTSSQMQIYGHYCSIVQLSRMGKLCLLDEFSKSHFIIPMNLCAPTDQGTSDHF